MEAPINFLDLWLEIYQEAIQLCDAINKLPDHCECGDADAHLEGRCPCCREHTSSTGDYAHTEDCTVLLTRLRADLTILCHESTGKSGRKKYDEISQKSECEREET
ncbi:hypothetical protein L0156_26265 [bacterium]|nr:hypothetical protein [bacterium]